MLAAALGLSVTTVGCVASDGGSRSSGDSPHDGPTPHQGSDAGADAGASRAVDAGADVGSGGDARLSDTGPDTLPPAAGTLAVGTNVVLGASGLPANGSIFFTTDGTFPNVTTSQVYTGGTAGIQVNQDETIFAIADAPGACAVSAIGSAVYTVTQPEAGAGPQTPIFAPAGGAVYRNDLTVAIGSIDADAICYTLDGTAPSCTSAGACAIGTAYAGASAGVLLPPAGSTSTTGSYTLSAVGCAAGQSSAVESQSYTMVAAAPTSSLASGTVAWTSGVSTILSTTTAGAILYYTTDGSAPACGVGAATTGEVLLTSGTLTAIACKSGYGPSPDSTSTYSVTLNPPTLTAATTTDIASFTATVSDVANASSGDWLCYATGPSESIAIPVCGLSSGVCSAGVRLVPTGGFGSIGVGTSGHEVAVIACAPPQLTSSPVVTGGPYVLQLSAPYILANGAAPPGLSRYTLTGNTFVTIGQTATYATPAAQEAGFACYIADPPAGALAACSGDGAECAAGSTKAVLQADGSDWDTGGSPVGPFAFGDSISSILCPAASGASAGYLPSAPVTVQFVGTGAAASPTVSPTTSSNSTYSSPLAPILVNENGYAVTACYTTDETAPACSNGTCTAGAALVLGAQDFAEVAFAIQNPGSLYSAPPTVTLSGGGGMCATAPVATLSGGSVTSISPATGCTGFTSPPTVTIDGGATATALPSNMAPIGTAIESNGTELQAVACSSVLTSTPPNATVYANSFVLAPPTASPPAGPIGPGEAITLSTTSSFADTIIAYTFDGSPPTCGGLGTNTIDGPSGVVSSSALPPAGFSGQLMAIACAGSGAANQITSALFDAGTYIVQ
jgi:hypothetical protein